MTPIRVIVGLLIFAVIASAVGLVQARHASRGLFADLRALERVRDEMNVQWGKLQLEQSAWGTHGRIERVGRNELGMRIPRQEEVVIVRP